MLWVSFAALMGLPLPASGPFLVNSCCPLLSRLMNTLGHLDAESGRAVQQEQAELSHLAGTGRCLGMLGIAILEVSRTWHQLARRGGEGRDLHGSIVDDALAPDQPCARCSLQPGRKQLREMFLQHYKFPTISYSSLT